MSQQKQDQKKDIDIRFLRLSQPLLNTFSTPLSGSYSSQNLKQDSNFPLLKNKFADFNVVDPGEINSENLFILNTAFGKIYSTEYLEAIISFVNVADFEISLTKLNITLRVCKKPETNAKEMERNVPIELPNKKVTLLPGQCHCTLIKVYMEIVSKYTIEIKLTTISPTYTSEYNVGKQRGIMNPKVDIFDVIPYKDSYGQDREIVQFVFNKKLTFDAAYPFQISDRFFNQQMENCLIEESINNMAIYPLAILDITLTPKSNKKYKIPCITKLAEKKPIILAPREILNLVFKIDDPDVYLNEGKFLMNITWLNISDSSKKYYLEEFSNKINIFNEFYNLKIKEKPNGNIVENQTFKIIFTLQPKAGANKNLI